MKIPITIALLAASAVSAQTAPPVKLIAAPDASSKPGFGLVAAVRQLPNGRLLINDVAKRQLVMLDPSLASATVIADSVSGGANSYGPRPGALVGYFADSTLFIDPADLSMFVIDPTGNIARVAAVPRSQDAGFMGSNLTGSPAIDGRGRLVYRGSPPRMMPQISSGGAFSMPELPDSSAIVRVDLATRKLDTAAFFKISKVKMNMTQSDKGGMMMTSEINPMQTLDDWAVLADGSIAIVRGRDYHIDWIAPDGSMASSPKMAFDWQRLTDEDKVAVIDSAKAAAERTRSAINIGGASGPVVGGGGDGGGVRTVVTFGGGDGARSGGPAGAPGLAPLTFVSASELPDYRPVFSGNAVKADLDGNVWVRTSAVRAGSVAGGPIYDVINRQGVVIDRLQVPAGRSIVGFGKGGVVYMLARDDKGAWVERTHR